MYSNGGLAATAVQKLAMAAWADGWGRGDALAARLKSAGADGQRPSNCQRDILRAAAAHGLVEHFPEPYEFMVPGAGAEPRPAFCMLPHETHFLARGQHHETPQRFCLSPGALAAETGLGRVMSDWASSEDVAFDEGPWRVAPLGLHGDGAQYTPSTRAGSGKSVYAVSYNYLAGDNRQRARRFLIAVLRKADCCDCGCSGWHTLQALFEVIAWSMQRLRWGVAPSARHDGTPWSLDDRRRRVPDGTPLPKAAIVQVRGDWEWLVQAFRFRHYSSEYQ